MRPVAQAAFQTPITRKPTALRRALSARLAKKPSVWPKRKPRRRNARRRRARPTPVLRRVMRPLAAQRPVRRPAALQPRAPRRPVRRPAAPRRRALRQLALRRPALRQPALRQPVPLRPAFPRRAKRLATLKFAHRLPDGACPVWPGGTLLLVEPRPHFFGGQSPQGRQHFRRHNARCFPQGHSFA